ADNRTDFWDTKTPGLGIRVGKRTKIFVAKLKNRRHTIGEFPGMTLSKARTALYTLKSAEKAPAATKRFSAALTEFIDEHYKNAKGRRTKTDAKRLLTSHFEAALGKKALADITDK